MIGAMHERRRHTARQERLDHRSSAQHVQNFKVYAYATAAYISGVLESYSVGLRLGASRWRSVHVAATARSALKSSRCVNMHWNVIIVNIGYTDCAVLGSHTPSTVESWTTHVTAAPFPGCVRRVRLRQLEQRKKETTADE